MNLKEKYQKTVVPSLKQEFGYTNDLAVPKILKVVVASGIGKAKDDAKISEVAQNTLQRITGQKPLITLARQSISAFKVREGMAVGLKVTLRGKRMWDFLTKLVAITLPRVRDFRGLSEKSFDKQGNFSIGFKEHLVFPEIKSDEVEKLHGLEVAVATSAKNKEEGLSLLKQLGFPFAN